MVQSLTLASALMLCALPSFAADFTAPEGCETFLTVQARECGVSNLYRCEGTPEGAFSEAYFSDAGLESIVAYDAQYQWMDARYAWDNSREVLIEPAEDPIDLGALLSEGVDTYRFNMRRTAPGEDREIMVTGADVLTDETARIDGVTLDVVTTDLQILAEDGTVEYQSRGRQFLDRARGLFFIGPEEVTEPDGAVTHYDGSPVDFIEPGQAGFASTLPLYECDELKAALPLQEFKG